MYPDHNNDFGEATYLGNVNRRITRSSEIGAIDIRGNFDRLDYWRFRVDTPGNFRIDLDPASSIYNSNMESPMKTLILCPVEGGRIPLYWDDIAKNEKEVKCFIIRVLDTPSLKISIAEKEIKSKFLVPPKMSAFPRGRWTAGM